MLIFDEKATLQLAHTVCPGLNQSRTIANNTKEEISGLSAILVLLSVIELE